MWKCTNCGNENIGKFCTKCGTKMPDIQENSIVVENAILAEEIPESEQYKVENEEQVAVETNENYGQYVQTEDTDVCVENEAKKKSKAKIIILIIVILAVIGALSAGAYFVINSNKVKSEQGDSKDKTVSDNDDRNSESRDDRSKQDEEEPADKIITYDDIKSEMSEDEFGYYLYASKMEYLSENGMHYHSAEEEEEFLNTKNGDKTNRDIVYDKAVNQALDVIVQCFEAEKRGLGMTEAEEKEFNEQLELTYTQNGGKQAVKQQLDEMGVTVRGFEEFNKRFIIVEKLYDSLIESGVLEVSDEEMSNYIKENYVAKDYVKAKHILFSTQDVYTYEILSDEEKAVKKALAEQTLAKIKAGEDFDALMNELSEDPGLEASPSGYIFTKGEMVVPFEEASYSLSENEVSEIVESDYGYHIIKRVPITVETLGESEKLTITSEIQAQKSEQLTKKWKKEYIKNLK